MDTKTVQVYHICDKCGKWLSGLDLIRDVYMTNGNYWLVRDPGPDENWETCNPENPYQSYCEECHAYRLMKGRERGTV